MSTYPYTRMPQKHPEMWTLEKTLDPESGFTNSNLSPISYQLYDFE